MKLSQNGTGGLKGFFKAIGIAFRDYRLSLLITFAAVIGTVLLVNGGYYVASSNPESCLVCHYMQPHYDSWLNSAHKDVGCVECHPGRRTLIDSYMIRYITGTYHAQPFPDVKPKACLNCHDAGSLAGDITYKRDIKFNHEHHLGEMRRGKELRCTSCHAASQTGEHFAVDNEACYLCHFKEAEKGRSFTECSACHGIPKEPVKHGGFEFNHQTYVKTDDACISCHTSVVSGNGDVPDNKCFECHVERVDAKQDLKTLHKIHISDHGVDCFRCHDRIEHGKIEMSSAFQLACNQCHQPQHDQTVQMYIGAGGKGIEDTPSAMFDSQVSCDACHASASGEPATWTDKRDACVKCHGAGYDRMLDDWKRDFDRLTAETKTALTKAESNALSQSGESSVVRALLDNAKTNMALLESGKAVHNPFYGLKLATQISAAADTIAILTGRGKSPKPGMIAKPDGACNTCHASLPMAETIPFEKMNFPHGLHTAALDLSCNQCHTPAFHHDKTISKNACMECHHQEAEISCATCHFEAAGFYNGQLPDLGVVGAPDAMSTGGVSCKDCHNLASKQPTRAAVKEQCIACHDDSYGPMVDRWIATGTADISRLTNRIDSISVALKSQSPDSTLAKSSIAEARRLIASAAKAGSIHNPVNWNRVVKRIEATIDTVGGKIR